jgi:hypothetical protein
LREPLAVLQAFGENMEGKRLRLRYRFAARLAVGEYSRQLGHFGYPATVFFLFGFNAVHVLSISWNRTEAEAMAAM